VKSPSSHGFTRKKNAKARWIAGCRCRPACTAAWPLAMFGRRWCCYWNLGVPKMWYEWYEWFTTRIIHIQLLVWQSSVETMYKHMCIYIYTYICICVYYIHMQTPPCYSEGGTKEAKHPRNSLKQTTMVYLNIWGVVLTLPNASIVVRKCKERDIE
jgi:hypothetical protein